MKSLARAQTDEVFKLTQLVINTYSDVIKAVSPSNDSKLLENLKSFQRCVQNTLEDHISAFKRKNHIQNKNTFVPPQEKTIGYRWTQTFHEKTGQIERKYKQNTFQFIPPSSTIQALFSNADFVKMYSEAVTNKHKQHECKDSTYKDYCCAGNFRQSDFLRNNPNALQIM